MTHEQREQAAEVLEKFQKGIYGYGGKVGVAIDTAIAALRGPQPDPITGLVPCGCGKDAVLALTYGKYEKESDMQEFKLRAHCPDSHVSTRTYIGFYHDGIDECDVKGTVLHDWNRAMGYKGGAE